MHDDLTDLERRLAACRPSAAGLDPDALLFAAGQAAAARPSATRFVWPAVACGFAVLSLALGAGLVTERSERIALAERLRRPSPEVPAPSPLIAPSPQLSPDSYLAARRQVEEDANMWLAHHDAPATAVHDVPQPAVLRAWGIGFDQ